MKFEKYIIVISATLFVLIITLFLLINLMNEPTVKTAYVNYEVVLKNSNEFQALKVEIVSKFKKERAAIDSLNKLGNRSDKELLFLKNSQGIVDSLYIQKQLISDERYKFITKKINSIISEFTRKNKFVPNKYDLIYISEYTGVKKPILFAYESTDITYEIIKRLNNN